MPIITLFLKYIQFCQVLSNHVVNFISSVVFSVLSIPFEKGGKELRFGKSVDGRWFFYLNTIPVDISYINEKQMSILNCYENSKAKIPAL